MLVSLIICLFFLLYSRLHKLDMLDPICIFFLMWTFITGMYCLDLGDVLPPSLSTKMLFVSGLLFFGIGAVVSRNSFMLKHELSTKRNGCIPFDYNFTYWVFIIMCWGIMCIAAFKSLPYLLAGIDLHEIRYQMREEILGSITIPFIYFAEPVSYVILYYNFLKIYKHESIKIPSLCIVITIILTLLCTGGRFFLYYTCIGFLFLYFSSNIQITRKPFRKRNLMTQLILTVGLACILIGIILLTGEGKLFSTIYSYFCGCIKLLDVKIADFSETGYYTLGATSFNGFIRPIFVILRALGLIGDLPQIVSVSEGYLLSAEEISHDVFANGTYNGFVSLFYAFYVDFGFIGVVMGSFCWGMFCERSFLKMKYRGCDRDIIIYLFVLMALSISMTRFAFCTYQYALAYVYLYLIFQFGRKCKNAKQ